MDATEKIATLRRLHAAGDIRSGWLDRLWLFQLQTEEYSEVGT